MANPVCLSPLKFYDNPAKQSHHKTYAYKHISPLISRLSYIPSFQFVLHGNDTLDSIYLRNIKDERVTSDIKREFLETGFSIDIINDYVVVLYDGLLPILSLKLEGEYYLEINFSEKSYYSEIFCATNALSDCLEIEYWNRSSDFFIKNGLVTFQNNFHFKLLLKSELGKPDYTFEEESTKRLGYNFVESQVSKKVYRFNTVVPEFICDAMRIIRLCDNRIVRCKDEEYDAINFEMEVDWQTQGDLASVNCEFETDNVIVNLGGFIPDELGGAYNDDFNDDFDNQ